MELTEEPVQVITTATRLSYADTSNTSVIADSEINANLRMDNLNFASTSRLNSLLVVECQEMETA